MSLSWIVVVILIIILLGGVGPTFYQGAPWGRRLRLRQWRHWRSRRHPDHRRSSWRACWELTLLT